MPFSNRIRLSVELKKAQFPESREVFRKANGVTKTLSVEVRKTYEGATDFWPEVWHQRFKIALAHDNVRVEGDRYLGDIAQEGEYQINWPDFLDFPTAPAEFKVQVTPFDATNSNCQTCEEATQLTLEDDQANGVYTPLQEDEDYTVDTAANDVICCYPAVFSLTSYNSTYLISASINAATGLLSFHTGTGLTEVNGLLIATYRVTCPNGGYDEANVYADIDGSVPGCLAPTSLTLTVISATSELAEWTEAVPGSDYYWELYEGTSPIGSPVQTGTVTATNVELTGLDPETDYYFQIRTVCDGSESNFIGDTFTTIENTNTCGQYKLTNNGDQPYTGIGYINCEGNPAPIQYIMYQSELYICALQSSPGVPASISASPNVSIEYIGLC